MPGQLLTLDLVANDQASKQIAAVAEQAGVLDRELGSLLKASTALVRGQRVQAQTTSALLKEDARLLTASSQYVTAQARATRAAAQQAKASAETTRAIAAERRSVAELTRANDQLARSTRAAEKRGRVDLLGGDGGLKILNNLSGGLAGSVAQYGALGPAALAAAAGVGVFSAAVDVSVGALKLQANFLTQSVQAALAFEQEITRVAAVTGEGAQAFDQLRRAALAGGASTLFTAQQAAEALRFLAQAGLSADQTSRALPGALQLAAAGSLDLAKAADIATNVMSGFQLGVEGLNRVNDVLVLGANKSNTNVQELGIAFSYAAGTAKSAGNEIEDITAVFQVLANQGIKASRAGTAVATGIVRLQKPTPEAVATLARLNLTLEDGTGKMKPFVQILNELGKSAATDADIFRIFGQVAGGKLITIIRGNTDELNKLAAANRNAAGAAAEYQRILQDTADAQSKIFLSTIETLSITIGEQFLPNVKGVSQALTEQATITANNTQLLGEFEQISDATVQTLANLLRISSDIVPPLIQLGGVVLTLGENFGFFVDGVVRGVAPTAQLISSINTLSGSVDGAQSSFISGTGIIGSTAVAFDKYLNTTEGANSSIGKFISTQRAANDVADEARKRLLGAADAISGVDSAAVKGQRVLLLAATSARRFAIEAGLIEPPKQAATLAQVVKSLTVSYDAATAAALRFARVSVAGGASADEVTPELASLREVAKLEAQIANTTDARQRAELEFELEISRIRKEGLDTEVQLSREQEALGKLNASLRAADEAGRKTSKKARKEDITSKLAELAISQRLLTTDDERLKVELSYEASVTRINGSQDKAALKAAQRQVAQIERGRALLALERERTQELRAIELSIREQEAALGQLSQTQLISLQRQTALASLAAETGLDDTVRAERARLILLEEQVKAAETLRTLRATEATREASFEALALFDLEQRGDAESQIATLKIQSAQRLRQIAAEETDAITRQNAQRLEQLKTEADIAKVRAQTALARTDAVRTGFAAGAATDTGAVSAQFAAEQERGLTLQVQALEVAKQQVELRGQDATFLERRIEQLRAEAEAERAVVEAQVARIEGTAQLAAGIGDLSTRIADVARIGFEGEDGYRAMGDAIASAAGLGSALATGLGLSAKAAAKVQVAFNAAASIAAFAGFAASGFSQPNLLTASIQYGLAAAKFAAVAGAGGGGGAGGGRGGGAGGGSFVAPQFDAAAERDKTAQAFAKALRAQLEQPVQNVFNLDFRQATLLESTPAIGREVLNATDRARGSIHQSGQRRSGTR